MLRLSLLCILMAPTLCWGQSVTLPYNPDSNQDSAIGSPDLLDFLPLFGGYFAPTEVLLDGQTVTTYIESIQETTDSVTIPMLPGTAPGQMLYWNGAEWALVATGTPGDALILDGTTPTWQPLSGPLGEVGCADAMACNYSPNATVNYAALCLYSDVCGICNGPGAIYDCGCSDLPEVDCDCDGNQLDALNVCGGNCLEDSDGDGICDDDGNDDCVGVVDACGICNGPGAIYACGCSGIAAAACDCAGTPDLDQDGICDTIDSCVGTDTDGDGICDDVDDCAGTYDVCGVCNGPGPVYDCGCSDLPEGDCDCSGNQPDLNGDCQDYAADTDGDGFYDILLEACLNQTTYSFDGHDYGLVAIGDRCWFQQNLQSTHYANGASIDHLPLESDWNAASAGAYAVYGGDEAAVETYGLLYNWLTTVDPRGACPTGWAVASEYEWSELAYALGGTAVAGGALKESGTLHWEAPNTGATNASGFTALPSGERGYGTTGFVDRGTAGHFWTSTQSGAGGRSIRLNHDSQAITVFTVGSGRGKALRCLRKPASFGCTDINFLEYTAESNVDDGSCTTPSFPGCTDPGFAEYDPQANINDGSCATLTGCTDTTTVSYQGYGYDVVAIGNQCWFRENLRNTAYRSGQDILNAQDPVEWSGLYDVGAYAAYNNDMANVATYGYLYNGYAVDGELCPTGWHVPTDDEWKEMELYLGVPASEINATGVRGEAQNVGTAMKSSPSDSPSWNGTNASRFSGLGGGYRSNNGSFDSSGIEGFWWGQSSYWGDDYMRSLNGTVQGVYRYNYSNLFGLSVRCMRSHLGCTDSGACNYDAEANEDDGSCEFLSCAYCNVASACNFGGPGTLLNNGSCEFPEYGYDCAGDCLPEFIDSEGACQIDEFDCSGGIFNSTVVSDPMSQGEYQIIPFTASGSLEVIYINCDWTDTDSENWPGDMSLALIDPQGTTYFVNGYANPLPGLGFSPNSSDPWPNDWNTEASGIYESNFTPGVELTGTGTWNLVIANGYGPQIIQYVLDLDFVGLCIE
jgi:uncharacterized protein (TIGR02145 family)